MRAIVKTNFCLYPDGMENRYRLISGKHDIAIKYNNLHGGELLAVGIMDTGTKDELEQTLAWYSENFDHALHATVQEERVLSGELQRKFPNVTFIVFEKSPTLAQRIGAIANECMATFFYITRSDIQTIAFDWDYMSAKLKSDDKIAVLTPLVFNKNHEIVPTVRAPQIEKNSVEPLSFIPSKGDDANFYPFLGLGFYDRAIFQRMRGYDMEIKSAYWQVMDYGMRCWMYGYKIFSVNYLAVIFPTKQYLIEDRSECAGTERFYTKALGVVMSRDGTAKIRKARKVNGKILINEVKPKISLYKTDFQSLCAFWQTPKEES